MARSGSRDTKPEVQIRRLLHALGLRYRVDCSVLPGVRRRADLVFGPARVVVLVDGCFWHGCPEHATWPKHNADFWREKIEANRDRDRDTDRRLEDAGWLVVRVWEHEDPREAARRIERLVRSRTSA
jgi:DNA mismatch endonuclease (patch repair protein)